MFPKPTCATSPAGSVTSRTRMRTPPVLKRDQKDDERSIPSDESDTGEFVIPTSKRLRKRKHIPVPRIVNFTAKKVRHEELRLPEDITVRSGSSESEINDETKEKETPKTIDIPTITSSSKPNDPIPNCNKLRVPAKSPEIQASHSQTTEGRRNPVGKQLTVYVKEQPNANRNLLNRRQERRKNYVKYQYKKWILFSVCNPSWKSVLKYENGKLAIESSQFKELILSAVGDLAPFPDYFKYQKNFVVISTEEVRKGRNGKPMLISGNVCGFSENQETIRNTKRTIKLKPVISECEKFLPTLTSPGDLIVLFNPCSKIRAKRSACPCIIHVTVREHSKPTQVKLLQDLKTNNGFGCTQNKAGSTNIHTYYILLPDPRKCSNKPSTSKSATNGQTWSGGRGLEDPNVVVIPDAVPVPSTSKSSARVLALNQQHMKSQGASKRHADSAFMDQDSKDDHSRTRKASKRGKHNDKDICNNAQVQEEIEGRSERREDGDAENVSRINDEDYQLDEVQCTNFSLEYWMNEGILVADPSRPSPTASDTKNTYVYHTLGELETLLESSVEKELQETKKPLMTVKQRCHVYGVVVKVSQNYRHKNSCIVRISDETMNSVLLRIHSTTSYDTAIGPPIKVGNIIRVHRVKVQMEWDPDLGENTMVLSTTPHHNYCLFTQSPKTYQFYYHTCAKNITLDDVDKMRIGELHVFQKTNADQLTTRDENETVMSVQAEPFNDEDLPVGESQCSVLSSLSDGINSSDLVSPHGSEIANVNDLENDYYRVTSDESFVSAQNSSEVQQLFSEDTTANQHKSPSTNCVSSPHPGITLFKDIRKNTDTLNLLCQVVTVGAVGTRDIWHLFIKDEEGTIPSHEFTNSNGRVNDCLTLRITNAKKFAERKIASTLYEYQGTNEFFLLEDVKVVGAEPPYRLQMDGETCNICRDANNIAYLGLEETFSGSISNTSQDKDAFNTSDHANTVVEKEPRDVAVVSDIIEGEDDDRGTVDERACNTRASSSNSSYFSAEEPSSPQRNLPNDSQIPRDLQMNNNNMEEWTGRLRGKRKPREHYEREDTFMC